MNEEELSLQLINKLQFNSRCTPEYKFFCLFMLSFIEPGTKVYKYWYKQLTKNSREDYHNYD